MTEDQQIVPVDVALKGALRKARFDPRIADSVKALARVGIDIPSDSPPGYVMAAWLERMEGLREGRRANLQLSKECRAKARRLRRELESLAPGSDQAKKALADIESYLADAREYDTAHIQFSCRVGEAGKDIMHLHEKIRSTVPEGPGAVSWDPDAPKQQVNLQVNVNSPASVSVEEK